MSGSMWQEFKSFAFKGNAFDLAIGVIIGAAFGKIVSSLVDDIIMPIIGRLTGGLDFNNYFLGLNANVTATNLTAAREQGAVLAYGSFITVLINFLIIAFILFLIIKAINRMKKKEEAKPEAVAEIPQDVKLLGEIRDLLAGSQARV